jgi:hypothetical protein
MHSTTAEPVELSALAAFRRGVNTWEIGYFHPPNYENDLISI